MLSWCFGRGGAFIGLVFIKLIICWQKKTSSGVHYCFQNVGPCKIFTIILKEVYDLFSKDAFKGIVHTKMMFCY